MSYECSDGLTKIYGLKCLDNMHISCGCKSYIVLGIGRNLRCYDTDGTTFKSSAALDLKT